MKLYLRNIENFFPETVKFYKDNFELTEEKDAHIIVINDFNPIKADKIVACNSTGIDHIEAPKIVSLRGEDLSELTAVAELCLAPMVLLMRESGRELKGKTLGLIGYGRIARQLEHFAQCLGMNIISVDKIGNIKFLLENADVVSLHITSDEENKYFMNHEMFKMMKPGSIFLNSARPWLVDELDLLWALDNRLFGAWQDFETGIKHPKLLTTPHWGGSTKESKQKTEMIIAKKLCQLKNS